MNALRFIDVCVKEKRVPIAFFALAGFLSCSTLVAQDTFSGKTKYLPAAGTHTTGLYTDSLFIPMTPYQHQLTLTLDAFSPVLNNNIYMYVEYHLSRNFSLYAPISVFPGPYLHDQPFWQNENYVGAGIKGNVISPFKKWGISGGIAYTQGMAYSSENSRSGYSNSLNLNVFVDYSLKNNFGLVFYMDIIFLRFGYDFTGGFEPLMYHFGVYKKLNL